MILFSLALGLLPLGSGFLPLIPLALGGNDSGILNSAAPALRCSSYGSINLRRADGGTDQQHVEATRFGLGGRLSPLVVPPGAGGGAGAAGTTAELVINHLPQTVQRHLKDKQEEPDHFNGILHAREKMDVKTD